eukprot:symbB.v1.2.012892.t1/scaffold898.1/size154235/12
MNQVAWPLLLALSGAQAALRPVAERLDGACGDGPPGPDDLASYWLVSTWHGHTDRTDLNELREFNVRPLLLHHCVVQSNIGDFLDKAWMKGLSVVVELQPQLFLEPTSGCFVTGFDCYQRIKVAYRQMLNASGVHCGVHLYCCPRLYHERLVAEWIREELYVVVTPDRDVYAEDLSISNPDIRTLKMKPSDRGLPAGVAAGEVYALPRWGENQLRTLKEKAAAVAQEERGLARRGRWRSFEVGCRRSYGAIFARR